MSPNSAINWWQFCLIPAAGAALECGGMIIDADFVLGLIPFIAKVFDFDEVTGEDMSDLAQLQLACVIPKRAEIYQAFSTTEQFGQKIVANGHDRFFKREFGRQTVCRFSFLPQPSPPSV